VDLQFNAEPKSWWGPSTVGSRLSDLNGAKRWSDNRKCWITGRIMKKTRVNINSIYNSIYNIIKLQRKYNAASNEKI
jgi:hypothetical protein